MRNVGLGIPALHPGRKSKRARHVGVEVSLLEASRDLDKICSPRCQRNAVLRDNRNAHVAGPSEEGDFRLKQKDADRRTSAETANKLWPE